MPSFTIDDVTYDIENLNDEQKTQLNLIGYASKTINENEIMNNLLLIAKDSLVSTLKSSLENDDFS